MNQIQELMSSIYSTTGERVDLSYCGAVFTASSGGKSAGSLIALDALKRLAELLQEHIRPAKPLDGDGLDRYIMERYHGEQEKGRKTIPGQMSHTAYCERGFDTSEYWRLTYQSHIIRVSENGRDLICMFAYAGESNYQVYTVSNDPTIQLYMDEHVSGLDSWENPGLKKKPVSTG